MCYIKALKCDFKKIIFDDRFYFVTLFLFYFNWCITLKLWIIVKENVMFEQCMCFMVFLSSQWYLSHQNFTTSLLWTLSKEFTCSLLKYHYITVMCDCTTVQNNSRMSCCFLQPVSLNWGSPDGSSHTGLCLSDSTEEAGSPMVAWRCTGHIWLCLPAHNWVCIFIWHINISCEYTSNFETLVVSMFLPR